MFCLLNININKKKNSFRNKINSIKQLKKNICFLNNSLNCIKKKKY